MVIGICDDDKNARDVLADKVKEHMPYAKIIQFSTGDNLLICSTDLDIVFLDIKMPGTNGMQVAKEIRKANKDIQIAFVTGVEEYVFHAFDVGALHYLVKPVDEKKLEEVLKKAEELISARKK